MVPSQKFRLPCTLSLSKGIGVLVAYASQARRLGSISLQPRLLVTLKIRNKDPLYDWFLTWFAPQTKFAQNLLEESAGHEAASLVLRQGCTKNKTLETPSRRTRELLFQKSWNIDYKLRAVTNSETCAVSSGDS